MCVKKGLDYNMVPRIPMYRHLLDGSVNNSNRSGFGIT